MTHNPTKEPLLTSQHSLPNNLSNHSNAPPLYASEDINTSLKGRPPSKIIFKI